MPPPVLRPWLDGLGGYTPGRAATSETGRLASNEAPEPPVWLQGLDESLATSLNRYPDPTVARLRSEIAAHHGVDVDEVVVGNGSDELIFLLVQAYAAFTGSITVASPGYSLYGLCARRLGAEVREVALDGWCHDLLTMAEQDVDIAFVCNPSNPTGTVVAPDDLARFVETAAASLVVVDEAYVDFVVESTLDVVELARREPRVVVLRTFSKAQALAGARVGYAIAHRDIVRTVSALRLPFSVNTLAQELALRAVQHRERTQEAVDELVRTRVELERMLERHGLQPVPSQASFVLAQCEDSDRLVTHLASHGIAVRPGRDLGIADAVRITVPAPSGLPLLEQALAGFSVAEVAS